MAPLLVVVSTHAPVQGGRDKSAPLHPLRATTPTPYPLPPIEKAEEKSTPPPHIIAPSILQTIRDTAKPLTCQTSRRTQTSEVNINIFVVQYNSEALFLCEGLTNGIQY